MAENGKRRQGNGNDERQLSRKNLLLAIVLGIVAIGIYVFFIMTHIR